MEGKLKNIKDWPLSKVITVSAPALFILSSFFFFIPFAIYSGNITDFNISLSAILHNYTLPSLIILAVICLIGQLLPSKAHEIFISILFVLGILIWFQGNILVWDYGVIGKGDIDWTIKSWRGWLDAIIWIILLIVSVTQYSKIYKTAALISWLFITLQIISVIVISYQNPKIWSQKKQKINYPPPKAIFELSKKQNVFHFILDEFQSTIFKEIIDKNKKHYYEAFNGFTFFEETTSAFPTTVMSVPSFLTGNVYKNDVPIKSFIDASYKGTSILNVVSNNGYDVDIAETVGWYNKGRHSTHYSIPIPYGITQRQYQALLAANMLDMVLFRSVPHFLKKLKYENKWSLSKISKSNDSKESVEAARNISHRAFLQDMIDKMTVSRVNPVYKYIHLNTTHYPAVMTKDCKCSDETLPWNWENIKIQDQCSLDHFMKFLQKLKDLGIYDSSLIIVHADHGYFRIPDSTNQIKIKNMSGLGDTGKNEDFAEMVCSSMPLVAIKPPGSTGTLKISNVQASLTDMPATISSLLGINVRFPGKSIFEIAPNESRKRTFVYYKEFNRPGDEYFKEMEEYVINGNASDQSSWNFVRKLNPSQK
jgi:hypothetical protein